jgi:uncharacterized membrane protein YccC
MREKQKIRISHQFRAGLIGLVAFVGASVSLAAYADSGTILFSVSSSFMGAPAGAER